MPPNKTLKSNTGFSFLSKDRGPTRTRIAESRDRPRTTAGPETAHSEAAHCATAGYTLTADHPSILCSEETQVLNTLHAPRTAWGAHMGVVAHRGIYRWRPHLPF